MSTRKSNRESDKPSVVTDSVKKYARAMASRGDMPPAKKQEAVKKYEERMLSMWGNDRH